MTREMVRDTGTGAVTRDVARDTDTCAMPREWPVTLAAPRAVTRWDSLCLPQGDINYGRLPNLLSAYTTSICGYPYINIL